MKIGILTLPLHTNYGGIIQAYALQTVLERMGHEVVVFQKDITPCFKLPLWKYPLSYLKRLLIKIFRNRHQEIFVEQRNRQEYQITHQHTNRFIVDNINVISIDKLRNINLNDIDCIVVGSDQIWRPIHVRNLFGTDISEMFLKFAEGWSGLKIAYAASFGVDFWEYNPSETAECKRLAPLFKSISVREISGVKLCSDYLEVEAEHVLDPTLLLDKIDYIDLIEKVNIPKCDGQLFSYILDETEEKLSYVNMVANSFKMKPYSLNLASHNSSDPLEKRIAQPVEKWLRCFYDAEFVITDSFHGCVFSIIFNKPFVAIGNVERGLSRFTSLLSLFGLGDRLVPNLNKQCLDNMNSLVDCSDKLNKMRELSKQFLINSLKK
jgi:hypothetical protein